ncbi:hypothetical protein ACFWN2_10565 [Lentzea sp. NPDC058436]|uniref:hypothetical protein n=1 Tax=Lentzea sp. NPDC058436 TaxID=3346499 RepID=UPI00365237DB
MAPTTRPRTRTWPFHVVAAALVIAGILMPHALLIAAGLILAGSVALRPSSER